MAKTDGIKWVNDNTSHPQHPLKQLYKNTPFRCDLCRTNSRGTRLRCDSCDFNLHESCSALPTTLPPNFFAHRRHPLHLTTSKPGLLSFRDCLLCRQSIRGASFKCKECGDVYLHPLCSRLPERLTGHAIHPIHALTLDEKKASGDCDACVEECKKWRYYCGACDVHIHIECVAKGIDGVRARQAAEERATGELIGSIGNILNLVVGESFN